MTNKAKEIFTRKLKGDPIGHDCFGRPVLEGDILLFAAKVGTDSEMRVIKVVDTLKDESYWAQPGAVKFRIRRAEYCRHSKTWTLQPTKSIITRLDATFLLEEPPQYIADLFEDDDDGK